MIPLSARDSRAQRCDKGVVMLSRAFDDSSAASLLNECPRKISRNALTSVR